ncbi:MAG: DNA topoisomerase 4 subunit A [Actinobacteria bacterium]|uniref:DNA topoisomerase (ATP-hydrolyzing) n=1 Tax=freshwater metagenome TaxID=449393 RepID=A0A6J7NMC0_9ZZZZ|nr:DNA topoisomerase 4 subunit A [Actinomycetota bacterium]MSW40672.1 DNA topoisomerase 4 subunit A [Actinomycetota bacterium]
MARRTATPPPPDAPERILDIDVSDEMRGSFLEYAYSVIYSRALPDARDGLKPVQRRILYTMAEMGLRPDRGHVKSARVVGEVMGKLHPHGDSAIYDALVRMAQPFSLRLPLVDGHGNFGSLDDGPAAYRYTEARLATSALLMTDSLDEDVVDFAPNYDGRETEPEVLPAAIPNLLVNGAAGIAVGMATNLAPHNLAEVVAAARHLLDHPDASLDSLMRFIPGPDLPTGGTIIGLDGIRDAYATGRGTFRIRATTRIDSVTARRQAIIVTELPYTVGPEKVVERITELVHAKKLTGISAVDDYTDGESGLQLVIECKAGFNPEAILEQLYRMTPMEDTFAVNAVVLVEGRPQTLGLIPLLRVFLDHRLEVVRRRSEFRRRKASERLHLVEGLLVAIIDIDEVIAVIRSSDDTAMARQRLIDVFDLTDIQTNYILEMPLRRLTRFSRIELEGEADQLRGVIAALTEILDDPARLRGVVSDELAEVARAHGTPRRTVLLESAGLPASLSTPLEVADEPCWVLLSSTGRLARTASTDPLPADGPRSKHDVLLSAVHSTARGEVGLVTSAGRIIRVGALELPVIPPTSGAPSLRGGAPLREFVTLARDETPLCLTTLGPESLGLAVGTAQGVVKRITPDVPLAKADWEVIRLDDGDRLVGAIELGSASDECVFITALGQLLHFPASAVRPQGRPAGGMAGIKLGSGDEAVFFGTLPLDRECVVVTVAGFSGALPGTEAGSAKVTRFSEFPGKGRATGGVRCHRFLRGEDRLTLAWVGPSPARATAPAGAPVDLPEADTRRDGSGVALSAPVSGVGGPV